MKEIYCDLDISEDMEFYSKLDAMIDEEIDSGKLVTKNKTIKTQALSQADELINKFRMFSQIENFNLEQKKPMLWFELIKKCRCACSKNLKLLIIYMLSDSNLFFEKTSGEQKIGSFFCTKKKIDFLSGWCEWYEKGRIRFDDLRKILKSTKTTANSSDSDILQRLVGTLVECRYCSVNVDKEILLENLDLIASIIESNEELKTIAPLIYFQALVHNRKKMLEKVSFTVNVKKLLTEKIYNISEDNGKNFKQYAEYCNLYIGLKECFPDADRSLCDVGFLKCSNLAQWFYENEEYNSEIPYTARAAIIACAVTLFREPYEDISFWKNSDFTIEKIFELRIKQPLLAEKMQKKADIIEFSDISEIMKNSEKFLHQFFRRAGIDAAELKGKLHIAQALLMNSIQIRLEDELENELENILEKW